MKLFDKFKKDEQLYLYSEKELDEYEKFIMDNFGEYDEVFHEIVSPDIHLDIIIIPPTKENNYYKLITMGMGAYKMNVPNELKEYELERAELVLYLPPTWNVKSNKEEDYWPIRYLKILARLPLNCNTWLGLGHTVSSNENNDPFAQNTNFCSILLLNGTNKNYETLDLRLKNGKKINFYQLFPLYLDELNYKQENSFQMLLDQIDDDDIVPVINIERKNYCQNKF